MPGARIPAIYVREADENGRPEIQMTTLVDNNHDHYFYWERLNVGQKYFFEIRHIKQANGNYNLVCKRDGLIKKTTVNQIHQSFGDIELIESMAYQAAPAVIEDLKIGEIKR